jgi:small GTP-binding protein
MEGEKYDRLVKMLMIGDSGVGKTCFLLRFVSDEHRVGHLPTVGIDFKMKTMQVGDVKLKLQLWDTAGQDRFQTLTNTFFKGNPCITQKELMGYCFYTR